MPTFLILDTSTQICAAALCIDEKITAFQHYAPKAHGRFILSLCQDLLEESNIQFSQLSAIAFVAGPGCFTGLRIAASVAQGIAVVHDLPVICLRLQQELHQAISLEEYQKYQKEKLVSLVRDYWEKKILVSAENAFPHYHNDIYS